MNKTPLPRWVLPLAIIFVAVLVLNGISFVVHAVSETKTHSIGEKIFLIVSLTFGVALVSAFWLRSLLRGPQLGARVVRWIILLPIILAFVFGMIALIDRTLKSAPEYELSQNFLRNNDALKREYGKIQELKSDFAGSSFQGSDTKRSGSYQFEIKGEQKSGLVRIFWTTQGGQFMPSEVDDVTDPANGSADDHTDLVTIWKK